MAGASELTGTPGRGKPGGLEDAVHERTGVVNARNGTRTKTVLAKAGPVQIDVPRDRGCMFEPVIVAKRQRRLDSIDDVVLSLSSRGMTHVDISAHLAERVRLACVERTRGGFRGR
jgi:transposase-like protein